MFRVGDRVRVIGDCDCLPGKVGTVVHIAPIDYEWHMPRNIQVQFTQSAYDDLDTMKYYYNEVELISAEKE
jgi:hypothetical protein